MQSDPDFIHASLIPIQEALERIRRQAPTADDPIVKVTRVVDALARWVDEVEDKINSEVSSLQLDLSSHKAEAPADAHEG